MTEQRFEGEFKKQIRRWLDSIQDGCERPHIEENRDYIEDKLSKIIEDAKKDLPFPITEFSRKLHPHSPANSEEKHKNLMQLIDWFTKWLGS